MRYQHFRKISRAECVNVVPGINTAFGSEGLLHLDKLLLALLEHTAYPYLNKAVLHARQPARKLRNREELKIEVFQFLTFSILNKAFNVTTHGGHTIGFGHEIQ